MISKRVTIMNEHGLHARIATRVAQMSRSLDSNITIRNGSVLARATSIIELLVLGAPEGCEVELIIEGGNESRNLEVIEEILSETVAV
jgi:phosphotransferase system HPr (HPr) family protein